MKQDFNIIIVAVGGQGAITLLRILAEASLLEGYDVKTSELHGLSQRGGSVRAQVRIGKKIFSPLIGGARADLILALEMTEALRAAPLGHKNTCFLVNERFISYFQGPSQRTVTQGLEKLGPGVWLVPASRICQEKWGQEVLAGIYLLGVAFVEKLIPLGPEFLEKAIAKIIVETFGESALALNLQAFRSYRSDRFD